MIDDDRDLTELSIRGSLQGLPDLAFLELAVAGHRRRHQPAPGRAGDLGVRELLLRGEELAASIVHRAEAAGFDAALGRTFSADDAGNLVVLSDGLWRRMFGGDPAVIGRIVRMNGSPFTVVGVARDVPGVRFGSQGAAGAGV